MKIKISPDGEAVIGDPNTSLRIGNLATSCPQEIKSKSGLHVEIELPNFHCNIGGEDPTTGQKACLMCPRSLPDYKKEVDQIDAVCNMLQPYLQNIERLEVTGLAEPFWKGRIFDMFEVLRIDMQSQIKIVTTTNATLLNQQVREKWFATVPKSEVRFSIDAANPETYVRIRRVYEFDLVVENVNQYCRERNPDLHTAVLSNNINLLNVNELEAMVQMAKDNFCHYLSLVPTASIGSHTKEICLNPNNESIFKEAAEKARKKAKELKVNIRFPSAWPN